MRTKELLELAKVAQWKEEGYKKALYCYYCKANGTPANKVNPNGYGCSNCKNYAETRNL